MGLGTSNSLVSNDSAACGACSESDTRDYHAADKYNCIGIYRFDEYGMVASGAYRILWQWLLLRMALLCGHNAAGISSEGLACRQCVHFGSYFSPLTRAIAPHLLAFLEICLFDRSLVM